MSDVNPTDLLETESDYVKTAGFMSPVEKYADEVNNYVIIGHVTMLDFEDTDLGDIIEYLDKHCELSHLFIFESSKDNYHGLNVELKSLGEVYCLKSWMDIDDDAHAEIGLDKGRWTLRTEEKGHKDKPTYIHTWLNSDNSVKLKVLSHPHLIALDKLYNIPIIYDFIAECKTMGETLPIVSYETDPDNHEKKGDKDE